MRSQRQNLRNIPVTYQDTQLMENSGLMANIYLPPQSISHSSESSMCRNLFKPQNIHKLYELLQFFVFKNDTTRGQRCNL